LYRFFGKEDDAASKAISDGLNKYFRKHGPDATDDFTSFCSCSMKYDTARVALTYAIKTAHRDLSKLPPEMVSRLPEAVIDGGYSQETDCRENDPVTGELLHSIPINKRMTLEELQYLVDQDKMSKDDWVWCDFVLNSFGDDDDEINAMLNRITRKFR
jgi:hypothetical protein